MDDQVDGSAPILSAEMVVEHEAVDADDRSEPPPTYGIGGIAAVAEGAGDVFEGIASQGLGPHPPVPWIEDDPRRCRRRFSGVLRGGLPSSPPAALGAALLLAFLGLIAAPGLAVDGDDAGGVGEGLTPLGEGPVGCDDGGVLLAAAGDDVEQQIGMAVAVGQVSDLVDHQQVLAGVEAQLALEQGVAVEGGEFAEHAGRGGEAHGVALEDGAMGDIGGDGRLADAVWDRPGRRWRPR